MDIRVLLTGTTKLMTHSDEAAVPGNPIYEAKERLAAKRARTDVETEELFYLEWLGAHHLDDAKRPCVTTWSIVRCLANAATRLRKGAELERALIPFESLAVIHHGGPDTIDGLWAGGFWDRRMVKNSGRSGGRVPRCRPAYEAWAVSAVFDLDETLINLVDLRDFAEVAGRLYGLGDARRLGYGRFTATVEVIG